MYYALCPVELPKPSLYEGDSSIKQLPSTCTVVNNMVLKQTTITTFITGNKKKKSEISTMRKNKRPYIYVGLGEVENGHMVSVGWVWVLQRHYVQSFKIVNFHGGNIFQSSCAVFTLYS